MSTPAAAVLDSTTTQPAAGSQPTAPTTPFFNDWIKPDAPDAKDLKDFLGNKNFPDPATLVKSYRETERTAAELRNAVNLKAYPTESKNPDGTVKAPDANQLKAWDTTMGVPESPDKYDIQIPSSNPYPQFKSYLADEMHKAHVPAAMASNLAKGYEAAVTKMLANLSEQENTASTTALAELEREWGSNYQERVSLAQRGKEWIAKEVGGLNDVQMRTLETVLGTSKFMSMMWKFGAGNKEPGFAGSGGNPATFGNQASAAQTELDQITNDRSAGKISDLEWRSKEARVNDLIKIITGGMASPSH